MNRLSSWVFLGAMLCGGCASALEVYRFRQEQRPLPVALESSAAVRLIDISAEAATEFEDARQRLGATTKLGTFYAINRDGVRLEPLRPELEGFARQHGGDVVIVSCAPRLSDGRDALVCSGWLLRASPSANAIPAAPVSDQNFR